MQGKRKTRGLIIAVIISIILVGVIGLLYVQNNGNGDNEEVNPTTKELTDYSTTDWTSFEISIDNKVYTWPITYAQLVDDGYVLRKEDVDYEAIAEKYDSMGHTMYNEGDKTIWLSVSFKNYVLPDYNSPDCYVYNLTIIKGFIENNDDFVLCNGIKLDASYEEVVSAMGYEEEKDYYVGSGDDRFDVTYENEDGTREIRFTFVDDKLERIEMYDIE